MDDGLTGFEYPADLRGMVSVIFDEIERERTILLCEEVPIRDELMRCGVGWHESSCGCGDEREAWLV